MNKMYFFIGKHNLPSVFTFRVYVIEPFKHVSVGILQCNIPDNVSGIAR